MHSYRFKDLLCRSHIVGLVILREQTADLSLIHDNRVSARKAVGPWTSFGEIRLDDLNARFPGRFEPADLLLEMARRRQVFYPDERS